MPDKCNDKSNYYIPLIPVYIKNHPAMIKYLLIEDEHFAYEEIKRLMQKIRPNYVLVDWAESIEQAIPLLKQGNIDLLILDIRLSDGICFEIFEQYPVDIPLLFTTAYDEYALKAFKLNSIDYLLKPVDEQELNNALCKFERKIYTTAQSSEYKQLEKMYLSNHRKNRFLIQIGDSYQYAETKDVAFFYSEEKYVYLHLFSGQRYIVNYSLEQIDKMLDNTTFFRTSRNCIANIRSIKKISKHFMGRLKLQFQPECPQEVLVSRSRAERFLKWIDGIL